MDLDNLKAFVAVAHCKSFSLAAQELFITQPAISKRIASLEQSVDARLFERLGKLILLTQAGSTLLPQAENILALIKEAKKTMNDLSGEISGELKVATSHHLGLHKLPPVLRDFSKQYPKVNLKFDFLDSEVAIERVLSGDCELAIVTLPPNPIDNIALTPVWRDPLAFVVDKDTPLNQDCDLEELSRYPAILPDTSTYTGRLVKQCFDKNHLRLTVSMTTNYLETIKMMVSVGLGWSVLPQSMVDEHLKVLRVKQGGLMRHLGIAQHQKRQLGNAAKAFLNVLHANRIAKFEISDS